MKENKYNKRRIKIFILIAISSILIWIAIEEIGDIKLKKEAIKEPYEVEDIKSQYKIEIKQEEIVKQYPKVGIKNEYKDHIVAAKLEIPAIELETYILDKYSKEALNISVTKFWGADPNQIGNFCVAGHNFKNKNMFYNLKKLDIGEKIFISDNTVGRIEYEINNIDIVDPEDVSCLSQETNGKREVTLITCTNDSKKRIIVKAKEIN